jgi:Domain of unknown function (DUF4124)
MLRWAAMLRPVIVSALIAAGLCSVAHADVYRWVDDKGEPHYSDRWVPGSELIKSDKPHPQTPTPSASSPTTTQHAASPAAADRANEEAVKQDVAKTRDVQCKQAKDRYQKAIDARRISKPSQPGDTDRVYMSDAEVDAYRAQARSDVTLACGSAPPPVSIDTPIPEPKPQQE